MKNKYILLRHGQTKYQATNSEILYTKEDQTSLPMTEFGENKMREAAKELKSKGIDIIYSSDFYRTQLTSKIISAETGSEIILDARLRDIDMGIYKGRHADEYRAFFEKRIQRFYKRPPEGECWRDVRKRMVEVIEDIEKKHQGKTVLIVSHGDPLWLLMSFFKKLTEEETLELKHSNTLYPDVGQYFDLTNL